MSKTIYDKASQIIAQRKKQREDMLNQRRTQVYGAVPRIAQIEKTLDSYGMRMLCAVASGQSDEKSAVNKIMAQNREFAAERARLLCENGFGENYLEPAFFCDKCGDSGYIGGKMCSCLKKEIMACALKEANLSEKMAHQTFDKFVLDYYSDEYINEYGCSPKENMQSIVSECIEYAGKFDSHNKNLLFCGGCGLGKTFLSSAISNALIENEKDVLYVSCNALFPILEDMHFGRNVSERNGYIVNKINECDLLLLDDLGSEFITQFTCAELFRIINNRMLNSKKMIISTNLNRGKLASVYGERIASRITGGFEIFEFFGKDIRSIIKLKQWRAEPHAVKTKNE